MMTSLKCPYCGADLKYIKAGEPLLCEYCGTTVLLGETGRRPEDASKEDGRKKRNRSRAFPLLVLLLAAGAASAFFFFKAGRQHSETVTPPTTATERSETVTPPTTVKTVTSAASVAESTGEEERQGEPVRYFRENKLVLVDIDIEITDYRILEPGETGNEYGEEPVIAFWYRVTNKTGKEIDALTAWIICFSAYQDNREDYLNELEIAPLPDKRYLNTRSARIKKGGTVACATAYTLSDRTAPVTLDARVPATQEKLGEQEFKLG